MLTRSSERGFTLIELLVTITILGVMVAMVMPSFSSMVQNSRLGSAAKSYSLGLQTARAEAIRHNTPVEFVLTDTPIGVNIETAAVASTTGKNWVVRYVDPASGPGYTKIEARGAQEGGGMVGTSPVQVEGVATAPAGAVFNGTISFNGLGAPVQGLGINLAVTNPAGGACASAGGPMRCQRVVVRPGGQVSVCDPTAALGDNRHC
jgi:type IV fimbrial biogenesis protein FimT